jgi:hypothetical protein
LRLKKGLKFAVAKAKVPHRTGNTTFNGQPKLVNGSVCKRYKHKKNQTLRRPENDFSIIEVHMSAPCLVQVRKYYPCGCD